MVKDASFMGGRSKAPQEQDDKTPLTHPLSTCKSERPYGRDGLDDYYRELRIPKDLAMAPGAEAMAWAEALCCIFTRISVWEDVPSEAYDYLYGFKSGSSRIIFYDGMYKSYDYDDLELMMKNVYTDLCDMSMGNRDCEYSMICVDDALKRHGGRQRRPDGLVSLHVLNHSVRVAKRFADEQLICIDAASPAAV